MGFDPEISEWGNLVVLVRHRPFLNQIGKGTRYPLK
jgi:hypothetical protein